MTTKRQFLAAICCAALSVEGSSLVAGQPACDCECKPRNPLFNVLDQVAGGIDKLLDFKICSTRTGASDCDACVPSFGDDGCDAMTMQELMMAPEPPVMFHQPNGTYSQASPTMAVPTPGPDHGMEPPTHSKGQTPIRMMPAQINPITEPAEAPRREPSVPTGSGVRPNSENNDGSLFDVLQDPFQDDSAQLQRSPKTSARTVGYRSSTQRAHKSR